MQRAQDMIVGAGIVGALIGAVAGGALWIVNENIDGNSAAFFGVLIAAVAFTVIYLGWLRAPAGGPTGPRDLSPSSDEMPGAGTLASKYAIGAPGGVGHGAPAAEAPAPAAPATAPEAPAAEEPAADVPQSRPAGMEAAREGGPDDLKRIKGVGPKLEDLLHSMGFYHFDQIASWTAEEVAWVDDNLEGFKGRVSRDEWIAQAKVLAQE